MVIWLNTDEKDIFVQFAGKREFFPLCCFIIRGDKFKGTFKSLLIIYVYQLFVMKIMINTGSMFPYEDVKKL